MHQYRETVEIKAPVQQVYDFINQPTNLPGVWPSLIEVSNVVPRAGGHDWDWTYKMLGVRLKGHTKLEEAQPGRLLRTMSEGAIVSSFRWTFQGLNGSGTRLTCEIDYTMPTPVIGKLAEALAVKLNKREADALLANIKEVMEHAPHGGVRPEAGARAH